MAILAQALLVRSGNETNLVLFAMVLEGRPDALAAQLGFLLRRSGRLLSAESDVIRFVSPIADVLRDIGDELHHLHHTCAWSAAPSHVVSEVHLLRALASRSAVGVLARPLVSELVPSFVQQSPVVTNLCHSLGLDHQCTDGVCTSSTGTFCSWCGLWSPTQSQVVACRALQDPMP